MDATAPHSRDPQIPALTDAIIDFAQFLDKDKLKGHKATIENLLHDKKVLLDKAMGYFAAAGKAYVAEKTAAQAALKTYELESLADKFFCRGDRPRLPWCNRRLFLTAVTPEGLISLAENAFDDCYVYALHTEEQIGTNRFLASIQQAANTNGISTESFHCPLDPTQIEYLHLPSQKKAFVSTGSIFGYNGKIDERIDLSSCINRSMFNRIKMDIERDDEILNALLEQTVDSLCAAKSLHSEVEEIYIRAMDFAHVDEMTENFVFDNIISV